MERRPLGDPPVDLPRLGLGCSRVGSFGNRTPILEVRRTLARALDLGVTVFDTANIYGQGDSEREIGRVLAGRRDEGFVVTKIGKRFSVKMRLVRPLKPLLMRVLARRPLASRAIVAQRDGNMDEDFSPARFAPELDASLRRLRSEYVDGLMLHSPPAAALGAAGVAEALQALVTAGKTRFFGVSVDDHACLEAALGLEGLTLLQAPLEVLDEAACSGLAALIARRRIAVFAREVIRSRTDVPPPVAVAQAAAREDVSCVLAGTNSVAHLDEIVAACATQRRNG